MQIRASVWRGKEQKPQTPGAVRDIDLPEAIAPLLSQYVVGKCGYLFATATGRPLSQRNMLRALHACSQKKVGFHAFRRFRTSVLRKAVVPEDLIRAWLGHAGRSVTDDYAGQIAADLNFRQQWAERAD